MRSRSVCLLALFLFLASAASASEIWYLVGVDTSSIFGDPGSIEFQFNPGAASQAAFLDISNFVFDGSPSGSPDVHGDVTGTLPPDLTFVNDNAWNDYFQTVSTFGYTISFLLHLYGPALVAPDHTSTSGSTFAFSVLDTLGEFPLLPASGDGYNFTVDVDLAGNTTVTNYSTETTDISRWTPEPASFLLVGAPLLVFAARRLRRRA